MFRRPPLLKKGANTMVGLLCASSRKEPSEQFPRTMMGAMVGETHSTRDHLRRSRAEPTLRGGPRSHSGDKQLPRLSGLKRANLDP